MRANPNCHNASNCRNGWLTDFVLLVHLPDARAREISDARFPVLDLTETESHDSVCRKINLLWRKLRSAPGFRIADRRFRHLTMVPIPAPVEKLLTKPDLLKNLGPSRRTQQVMLIGSLNCAGNSFQLVRKEEQRQYLSCFLEMMSVLLWTWQMIVISNPQDQSSTAPVKQIELAAMLSPYCF